MELCSDGHEEVCYESKKCPVCEEKRKSSDFEDEIYNLNEQISEMKKEQ